MIRLVATALAAVLLSACANKSTLVYDGKQYRSAKDFYQAIDTSTAAAASEVTPLPAPVSKKRLVFGFPGPDTVAAASVRNYTNMNGTSPTPGQLKLFKALAEGTRHETNGYFEALKRRGIYSSIRMVSLDSLTATPAASAEEDVLYWYETAPNAGTWYFVTDKGGKQVFAYDRAQPTQALRVKAFIDALQLQAIRD